MTTTTARFGQAGIGPLDPLSATDAEHGVVPRLRAVVTAMPDAVALVDAGGPVTFARLAAHAAAVLNAVRDAVGTGLEPVAVLHTHDAGAVAAILGVIASGHPVVVLDPRTPVPRLRRFAERVGARWCVTDAAERGAPRGAVVGRVVRPNLRLPADFGVGTDPSVLWAAPPPPDTPAALAFTSGSTGVPKVVVVDHRMVVHDAWVNTVATGCYGAGDVVAHTLPMAFFAGLMATVAGPLAGATMRLYDVRGDGIGALPGVGGGVGATVRRPARRSCARSPASPGPRAAFARPAVADPGRRDGSRRRRRGRAPPAAARVRRPQPVRVVGDRAGRRVRGRPADHDALDGALPVGTGAGGTRLALVRDDGSFASVGEAGTVTITARHLATGYLGDPEATAAAFTDNDDGTRTFASRDVGRFDAAGRLHLLGRRDHSVKIRGYLVEPGEVDAALFAIPGVAEAVTVGVPRPGTA